MRAFAQAHDSEELVRLIESMPVLRSLHFHAQLRQYQMAIARQAGADSVELSRFLEKYDDFFTLLHYRAYIEQEELADPLPRRPASEPLAPPFFQALCEQLEGRLPAEHGPTFDPVRDKTAVERELSTLTGNPRALPELDDGEGALWGALRVRCLRCNTERLSLRAHYLDLCVRPELAELIGQHRINADACPRCGASRALPVRAWVLQAPAPFDALATLSCLCWTTGAEVIYLPPPGTIRHEDRDRILEIRCDMMTRQLGVDRRRERSVPGFHGNVIAYSGRELIQRVRAAQQAGPALAGYFDIRNDIARKLASGVLSCRDAEAFLRTIAGPLLKTWPLVHASGNEPFGRLVTNLMLQASARSQGLPPATQAVIAALVSQNYVALGELGLAEMSLARADDLLRTASNEEAIAERPSLAAAREALLIAQGRRDEARVARQEAMSALDPANSLQRLEREGLLMNEAIHLLGEGRVAMAIQAMQRSVDGLARLDAELQPADPESAARARLLLSGSLANLADAYSMAARFMSLLQSLNEHGNDLSKLPPLAAAAVRGTRDADHLMAMQAELLERVQPLLNVQFPYGYTPQSVVAHAERLLRRALALARELDALEFLGIQSMNLGRLLRESGRPVEAAGAFTDAVRAAARAGDQVRLTHATWELAAEAATAGDPDKALEFLQQCLRSEMRQAIRSRNTSDNVMRISSKALACGLQATDGAKAILIAESGKKLSIAVSMSRGVPLQAKGGRGPDADDPLQELLSEREALRLRAMWDVDTSGATAQGMVDNEARLQAARREAEMRDSRYAAWHDATYLEVSDWHGVTRLFDAVGPHTTLAGFLVDGRTAYAYALWSAGHLLRRLELDEASIHALVTPGDGSALLALTTALLGSLEPRLATLDAGDALLVSPCEQLERVPFAAAEIGGRLLCQRATVSVVYGLGMLEACASRPVLPLQRAVCLGAPARPDVPKLVHAKSEVEAIASRLESAGVDARPLLLGADATVVNLRQRASEADLVHMACHALAPAAGQPDARLLLAPDLVARDSGVLSDDRIVSELVLKPGVHVNLAACGSGVVGGQQAFLYHGLVPALLVAGAASVLGCLWPIGDAAAMTFQSAYYEHLVAGFRPASALAAVQRKAALGAWGAEMQAPENWAGYVLYGAR